MLNKVIFAAVGFAVIAAGSVAPAQAKVHVGVYLGDPGYYPPPPPPPPYYPPPPVYDSGYDEDDGISCEEGRDVVRESGFYRVKPIDCDGSRLVYKARRDGYRYIVKVSRRTGNIVSAQPRY